MSYHTRPSAVYLSGAFSVYYTYSRCVLCLGLGNRGVLALRMECFVSVITGKYHFLDRNCNVELGFPRIDG